MARRYRERLRGGGAQRGGFDFPPGMARRYRAGWW